MTPEYIEKHEIIEKYLAGKLTDEEVTAFETRLLYDVELQDQFEVTERLRDGIRTLSPAQAAQWGPEVSRSETRGDEKSAPRQPMRFAATILVASLAGFILAHLTKGPVSPDQIQSQHVYTLPALRGTPDLDELPEVRRASDEAWLTLQFYPDLTGYASFRTELERMQTGDRWTRVWSGDPVAYGGTESVAVTLRGEFLTPGVYRLRTYALTGEGAPERAGEVYFRVR